jgi:hypothetical protein
MARAKFQNNAGKGRLASDGDDGRIDDDIRRSDGSATWAFHRPRLEL